MPMAVAENITILFTDLVGSTELAASLNPEVGDEVLRGHFSATASRHRRDGRYRGQGFG